jgi:predicted dehydrogenase
MLLWNDLVADEKIRVYDRGVEVDGREEAYDARINYRSGDIWVPRLEQAEALKTETHYFLECLENGQTPINDGVAGLRVVRIIEAIVTSLNKGGSVICLD